MKWAKRTFRCDDCGATREVTIWRPGDWTPRPSGWTRENSGRLRCPNCEAERRLNRALNMALLAEIPTEDGRD